MKKDKKHGHNFYEIQTKVVQMLSGRNSLYELVDGNDYNQEFDEINQLKDECTFPEDNNMVVVPVSLKNSKLTNNFFNKKYNSGTLQ